MQPERGHKQYWGILYLAARQSETAVDEALRTLLGSGGHQLRLVVGRVSQLVSSLANFLPRV